MAGGLTRLPCAVAAAVTTLVLAVPSTALADPPTAHTDPNPRIFQPVLPGRWAAEMRGDITTGGLDTTYYFQYALSVDQFCTSRGAFGTPSSSAIQILPAGFGRGNVLANVYGLANAASYCYRFVTTNRDGTAYGGIDTFTYSLPRPAIANLGAVTTTGARTATIVGQVLPNGQATAVEVAYDVAGSEFCTNQSSTDAAYHTPPVTIGANVTRQVVLVLTNLTPGTQYCAGLLATNPSGATLLRAINPFTAGVPLLQAGSTVAIGETGASVIGTVDPVGQATTYGVAYDAINSTWCRSEGASGAPSLATLQLPLPFTDASYHTVTVNVDGLAPTTGYCLALVAHNASGTTIAAAPAPLPVMPKLTVTVVNLSSLATSLHEGVVTSSPAGISCPGRCSATFPRGARITLKAIPRSGFGFNWDPCLSECQPFFRPVPPCPRASSCPIVLSDDLPVLVAFQQACTLRAAGRLVRKDELAFAVTCALPLPVTVTGTLTEIPGGSAKTETYALMRRQMTVPAGSSELDVRLPRQAVFALERGASVTATVTLTYTTLIGEESVRVRHLRVQLSRTLRHAVSVTAPRRRGSRVPRCAIQKQGACRRSR